MDPLRESAGRAAAASMVEAAYSQTQASPYAWERCGQHRREFLCAYGDNRIDCPQCRQERELLAADRMVRQAGETPTLQLVDHDEEESHSAAFCATMCLTIWGFVLGAAMGVFCMLWTARGPR